jgi:hypothetical protein
MARELISLQDFGKLIGPATRAKLTRDPAEPLPKDWRPLIQRKFARIFGS